MYVDIRETGKHSIFTIPGKKREKIPHGGNGKPRRHKGKRQGGLFGLMMQHSNLPSSEIP